MVKKNEGISVLKQKEYIVAEHKAHEELIKNGFSPSGMTEDFKKVIVFKIENRSRNNEQREIFHFNNWQEAFEELVAKPKKRED